MRLTEPQVEIIEQGSGEKGLYQQIEKAARVCYKSEDRITDESYKLMLAQLLHNGHFSALEHGTVYLMLDKCLAAVGFYRTNPYSRVNIVENTAYVTTNYRVIIEGQCEADLIWMCEPTEHHAKRITVHFISDISSNRDFNRHRLNSINEESTIYCNYAKNKFGNELSISKPVWITDDELANTNFGPDTFRSACGTIVAEYDKYKWTAVDYWLFANMSAEYCYMNLIRLGWPQKQARTILPLDTKSELIHTAFIDEWINFFYWRCDEAQPQVKHLACLVRDMFITNNCAPKDKLLNPIKLIKS